MVSDSNNIQMQAKILTAICLEIQIWLVDDSYLFDSLAFSKSILYICSKNLIAVPYKRPSALDFS